MAIEPFFTGTAALASIVAPPIFMRLFKMHGIVAFFISVIAANTISEIVFRLAKPDFHYGPLYGLGIIMNIVLTLILAGISVAITAVVLDFIEFNETK